MGYGEDDGDLYKDVMSGGFKRYMWEKRNGGEGRKEKLTRHPNCKLIPHNPLLAKPSKCLLLSLPLLPPCSSSSSSATRRNPSCCSSSSSPSPSSSSLLNPFFIFFFPPVSNSIPGNPFSTAAKYLILIGATKVLDTSTILLITRALVIENKENPELSKKVMNVAE